jgi:hypothetical protein
VSGPVYAGATVAAGTVLISGGAIVAALVAATLVGGAGGIVGGLLAKWLGDSQTHYLQRQIEHGGLLLWVRTRDAKAEERATDILKRTSSRDVHMHDIAVASLIGSDESVLLERAPHRRKRWNDATSRS